MAPETAPKMVVVKEGDRPRAIVTASLPAKVAAAPAQPEPLTRTESILASLPWKSSVMPGSDNLGAWSTEVQPVAPPASVIKRSKPAPAALPKRKRRVRRQSAILKARLAEIGPAATARLVTKFNAANVAWPPERIAFVAIKDQKVLELYARATGSSWNFIHSYPVLAASGHSGPKMRQGDRQVPEGIYRIVYLNPQSAYHVSLRVNYPNSFDRRMAAKDGRKKLGGDIMIHGKKSSAGCLAMGDPAVEELFVLAAKTGYSKVKLIMAPTDFRRNGIPDIGGRQPKWLPKLYAQISKAMTEFKTPPRRSPSLLSFFTQ
jgi:hypothetical protein